MGYGSVRYGRGGGCCQAGGKKAKTITANGFLTRRPEIQDIRQLDLILLMKISRERDKHKYNMVHLQIYIYPIREFNAAGSAHVVVRYCKRLSIERKSDTLIQRKRKLTRYRDILEHGQLKFVYTLQFLYIVRGILVYS